MMSPSQRGYEIWISIYVKSGIMKLFDICKNVSLLSMFTSLEWFSCKCNGIKKKKKKKGIEWVFERFSSQCRSIL